MLRDKYFGTQEILPPVKKLRFGSLNCLYENGFIRYVKLDEIEILRMIYVAVRDKFWITATYEREDENIEFQHDSFKINYTAKFHLNEILYRAKIKIIGKADNTLSFFMEGEALTSFYKNRIGICIHHPIQGCAGQPVTIVQPDEKKYTHNFPTLISPDQAFKNIQKMSWKMKNDIEASLSFSGDIFETEDQRNWTDASFKTYSTPLELPFPVWVEKGAQVTQHVHLEVIPGKLPVEKIEKKDFTLTGRKIPFPKIGFSKSKDVQQLSENEIQFLKEIPFDHYRVEIRLYENWKLNFIAALSEARRLMVPLEIILFLDGNYEEQIKNFIQISSKIKAEVNSILILHKDFPVTPEDLMEFSFAFIKSKLPHVKVGYGTDKFFAELNRNRPTLVKYDFLSYSINPQVHASDIRSLIENLEGQHDTIKTARSFSKGKEIFISPVTLKRRCPPDIAHDGFKEEGDGLPWNVDVRQPSEFLAAWTILSLKHLSPANSITFYETAGMRGIMLGDINHLHGDLFPAKPGELYPVYHYFKRIKSFQPTYIIEILYNDPLSRDRLVLENEKGEQLLFEVDFVAGLITERNFNI